ncbi:hypothetical protein ACWGQ5_36585 [Streptomyces sp. NPDC055722]
MADGVELGSVDLSLPRLSSVTSWLKDPHWGRLPGQQSGTAAGKRHQVSAKGTQAHRGAGASRARPRVSSPPTTRTRLP